MKKYLLLFLALLFLPAPVHAQFSRIISIQLVNNNDTVAQAFQSNFSIKVGASCTWSVTGTIATIDCAAGGTPGGSDGEVQFNNSGSFDGVTDTLGNVADCDGFGDPCHIQYNLGAGFEYAWALSKVGAPMGSYVAGYMFTDGGYYVSTFDGTGGGNLGMSSAAATLTASDGSNTVGFNADPANNAVEFSRFSFSSNSPTLVTGDFALSAGWGTTASVSAAGGTDNNFVVEVTSAGTGQGANPTVTFTYAGGDFNSGGASVPNFVCTQTGGDDIIADITITRGETSVVLTWHGTPTATKLYEMSCIGAQRN